jgi:hypothetical protein
MGAPRPTDRWFAAVTLIATLGAAACSTAGAPVSDTRPELRRAGGPICGLDEQVRKVYGLRDETVRPSEVVLRLVDHTTDQAIPDLALSLRGSAELLGTLDCALRTDRYGVARAWLAPTLYTIALPGRGDLVARTGPFYSAGEGPREIRVEKAGAISGRVIDERGKPLRRVSVSVGGDDGLCARVTDDAGAFGCQGLWSGEHTVNATGEDGASVSRTVMLAPGQQLGGVDLSPLPGGVLIVRATCGGPCVGATISAHIGEEVREEQVGPDGIVRLRGLPPGQVRLHGYRDDPRGRLRATAVGVNVQAGHTVNATLDLGRKRN